MARAQRKKKKVGSGFSPETKAELFAWENGICAFTGSSLWVLDYGASPLFHYDWADHVKPRSRGGSNDSGNGVSTSESANSDKAANGRMSGYSYVAGQVTYKALQMYGHVPPQTARLLRRDMHPEDWFLNRALVNLLWKTIGVVEGWTGSRIVEKKHHYPGAALEFLQTYRRRWQRLRETDSGPTPSQLLRELRARHLLPSGRLSEDQKVLLSLIEAETVEDVVATAKQLERYYRTNSRWVDRLDAWLGRCDTAGGRKLLKEMRLDRRVSPHLRKVITHNVRELSGTPLRPRDGGSKVRRLRRRAIDWPNGC